MEARILLDCNGVGAFTAYKGEGVSPVVVGGGVSTAGKLVFLHLLREAPGTSEKKCIIAVSQLLLHVWTFWKKKKNLTEILYLSASYAIVQDDCQSD